MRDEANKRSQDLRRFLNTPKAPIIIFFIDQLIPNIAKMQNVKREN